MDRCAVCQADPRTRPVKAKHRCSTCLRYLERHGYDRSVRMVDNQRRRDELQALALTG